MATVTRRRRRRRRQVPDDRLTAASRQPTAAIQMERLPDRVEAVQFTHLERLQCQVRKTARQVNTKQPAFRARRAADSDRKQITSYS